jgi:O-antigen/teichoic acid export membrane protein
MTGESPWRPGDSEAVPEPEKPASLASSATRATVLSLISAGGTNVVRLASNVVMTRLLAPEMYGQMAVMVTLDIGLRMLSDLGATYLIINNPNGGERRFLDTVFSVEALRGVLMWLAACVIAWPYAKFAGEPDLAYLLPVFLFSLVINGLTASKVGLLRREMRLGLVTVMELGEQVVSSVASILFAVFVERSIWALIVGVLAANAARVLFTHLAIPGPRQRFGWDAEVLKLTRVQGGWIFLSTALTYFAQRLDILIMPRLLTMEQVGVYNIANQLAFMPMFVGARIIGAVFLPAMAKVLREDPANHPKKYLEAMYVVLLGGGVACLGVALASPSFFYLLYDERYHAAQWLCPVLVGVAWLHYIQEVATREVLALSLSRPLAVTNAVKLVFTVGCCVIGYYLGGLVGFVIGTGVGASSGAIYLVMVLRTQGLEAGRLELQFSLVGGVLCLAGVGLPYLIAPMFGWVPALVSIGTAVVFGLPTLAWAAVSFKRRRAAVAT